MSPAILSIQPIHGTRNSSSFAIHFISRGMCESRRMSRIDWWFATTTYAPSASGQRPSTRSFQGG